jgi:hypothetical protein
MDDIFSSLGSVLNAGSQDAAAILGAIKGTSTTKPASATTTAAGSGSSVTKYLLIGGGILLAVVVAILAFRSKGK